MNAAPIGIVAALAEELAPLERFVVARRVECGLEVCELDIDGVAARACVTGVGKVMASKAAMLLVARERVGELLMVGVCGGLSPQLVPGTLVHCLRAVQSDLWVRPGRETEADSELREAWREVVPAVSATFVTADRAVFNPLRGWRLRRGFGGPLVCDMETAAVAAVAYSAGLPWAALRAVTDQPSFVDFGAFRRHFPVQAGRAAETVPDLLKRRSGRGGSSSAI